MRKIKCVLVGDGACDKTEMLIAFTTQNSQDYIPTAFDNYSVQLTIGGKNVDLQLWDTAGQEDYAKLRPLSYVQTDIFIVVFPLVCPTSLENVETMWIPEISQHCPGVPFILVGNKMISRDEFYDHEAEYRSKGWEPISREKGFEMKLKLKAKDYIECDSRDQNSLRNVFLSAAKIALGNEQNDIYRINIYGDEKSGRTDLAMRYIFGDYSSGHISLNEDEFIKIVEIKNKLIKLTIDCSDSSDLSVYNGLIFLFSIKNKQSFVNIKKSFEEIQKRTEIQIPFVIVANYCEMRNSESNENDLIQIKQYEELTKELKCELFEINSTSDDDIEIAFYHLINQFVNSIKEQKKKQKKKKPNTNIKRFKTSCKFKV